LLAEEAPDVIYPVLWPANSLDLNPVDYIICDKLQQRVYGHGHILDVASDGQLTGEF